MYMPKKLQPPTKPVVPSMASYALQDNLSQRGLDEAGGEDEEELFEIDLEAVSRIPPPHCYFTATGNIALLANCLLPISDVSSAVPIAPTRACKSLSLAEQLMLFRFQSPYPYVEEILGCSKRFSNGRN